MINWDIIFMQRICVYHLNNLTNDYVYVYIYNNTFFFILLASNSKTIQQIQSQHSVNKKLRKEKKTVSLSMITKILLERNELKKQK